MEDDGNLRNNIEKKRELAERLEKDPEFKEKYLKTQHEARQAKDLELIKKTQAIFSGQLEPEEQDDDQNNTSMLLPQDVQITVECSQAVSISFGKPKEESGIIEVPFSETPLGKKIPNISVKNSSGVNIYL